MMENVYFNIQIDCEATQRSVANPGLGERAIRGLGRIAAETGTRASFLVLPGDLRVHAAIYRELESEGHEIGLHAHPAEQGFEEFLGVHSAEDQRRIISEGMDVFAQCMGRRPEAFTPGYASANDHTFPVLESLGLRHGMVSIPTRNLPRCACVWGDSPLDPHYPHRYNHSLPGDVDFVDVPVTVDPTSRLWGGAHPQDLRVELTDAKNHYYTILKAVRRQLDAGEATPVKAIKVLTHNIFDFDDPANFRRETLLGIIQAARQVCDQFGVALVPATTARIAEEYRRKVPRPTAAGLTCDTRGRQFVSQGH